MIPRTTHTNTMFKKFNYSVMTSTFADIKDGDLVEISYHYKNTWVSLGKGRTFYNTVAGVKHATSEWASHSFANIKKGFKKDTGYRCTDEDFHGGLLLSLDEQREILMKAKRTQEDPTDGINYRKYAEGVCMLQYKFGRKVDKENGVWYNILRTDEQLARLASIKDEEARKRKEKRLRQKEAKHEEKAKKQEAEVQKRYMVRIKVPQPGGACNEGRQVVKSWVEDIKPSFYEELGWFEM